MTKRWTVIFTVVVLAAAACGTGGSSPTPGGTTSATGSPAATASTAASATASAASATGSAGASGSPAASGSAGASATASPAAVCNAAAGAGQAAGPSFDPTTISGPVDVGHWASSPAETTAFNCAVEGLTKTYTNLQVKNDQISDPYNDNMVTRFGSHSPPDVFFLNADIGLDWYAQGFLQPLDDYIAAQGLDMTKFFAGYQDTFKGADGKTFGVAKDGNTIAMAYNTDLVPTPPKTMDELVQMATSLKGKGTLTAPMCLSEGLDRGLAFMYAQGGSLLTADNSAEAISTDASKASVQWYMDLFKDGLGLPPPAKSWCGEQLGKQNAAIVFEGGWLLGYMQQTYPDVHWAFAEMPVGSSGSPATISYTAAYAIGADSANKDQGWTALQYLTGVDGMTLWTEGGIAVPSRSDVPVPQGFETIVKGAAYSKPGSGFMPHYNDVQKAFSDAFTLEVTNATYSADPVVSATSTAITTALSSQ
jgi:multiple sugar transport system substrate-binding protein